MVYKKLITRTNLIWSIRGLVLILLTTFNIPNIFLIAYILITLFYVVAYIYKNYWRMLGMLGIDLVSLMGIIFAIRVFYEGPSLAKASIFIIVSNILVKGYLAFYKPK